MPRKKCPICNSRNSRPIIYGYPTRELFGRAGSGAIILGGYPEEGENLSHKCMNCGQRFGVVIITPPPEPPPSKARIRYEEKIAAYRASLPKCAGCGAMMYPDSGAAAAADTSSPEPAQQVLCTRCKYQKKLHSNIPEGLSEAEREALIAKRRAEMKARIKERMERFRQSKMT